MNEHAGVARNFSFVYTLPVYVRASVCACRGGYFEMFDDLGGHFGIFDSQRHFLS